MINRKELANEILLRKYIRKAIDVVQERRTKASTQKRLEEQTLRRAIRQIIKEADPAITTAAVHNNTGINALEDLFKNSNLLSVLRQGYKSLTSKEEQRASYKNHILNAVEMSIKTEDARWIGPQATDVEVEETATELQEADINIDIGDNPEDNPAFIDVEDKEPTAEEEVEDFSIRGQDKTGRNRAYTDYKNVEKSILTAYDNLDDRKDREMFRDYLLTNLKLYFERFEEELAADLPAPDIEVPEDAEVAEPEEEVDLEAEEMLEWLVYNATKD